MTGGGLEAGLVVNGAERTYPPGEMPATVAELIRSTGLEPEMVVAEVNGRIVPRSALAGQALTPGDRVELVRLVGGG